MVESKVNKWNEALLATIDHSLKVRPLTIENKENKEGNTFLAEIKKRKRKKILKRFYSVRVINFPRVLLSGFMSYNHPLKGERNVVN